MARREEHPGKPFLQLEKMPSVWCSGCGIGIAVNALIQTLQKIPFPLERIQLISSGLGCIGKVRDYVTFSLSASSHSDPFVTALNTQGKNREAKTIIFFQDADIMVHGLEGMIRACHSGENLTAVYINGFIYHTLCLHKKSRNSFREEFNGFSSDVMFNLPYLAFRSGASVVARWTPLHCRRLASSLHAGLTNPGFSFVEVVSPCLMYFAGTENETITLDRMAPYGNNARINHNAAWADLEIHDIRSFIIGHFTEKNDS